MPSEYLLAAPVLGIVWPSLAVALWWGAVSAIVKPLLDEKTPCADGNETPTP
ncbi:MAG TPA: hypothetical protein VMA37_15325 [Acetobacteraceae bacterium]|nr:hypothetical protein [Acetobacteraceae bacterium]